MPKPECHERTHWIDLYRDHGKLLRADSDEEYPEYEGLDIIPGDEPAALVIKYKVIVEFMPVSFDTPPAGDWEYETVLESVKLQVGFSEQMKHYDLPKATEDAIWNEAESEVIT